MKNKIFIFVKTIQLFGFALTSVLVVVLWIANILGRFLVEGSSAALDYFSSLGKEMFNAEPNSNRQSEK